MVGVIYWSGTGNTEAMAEAVRAGLEAAGQEVYFGRVEDASVEEALTFDKLAFGCPAMGDEVLEELDFDSFFMALEGKLSGKKIVLFGSYGWGTGEWMDSWVVRAKEAGAVIVGTAIANYTPNTAAISACEDLGKQLAEA